MGQEKTKDYEVIAELMFTEEDPARLSHEEMQAAGLHIETDKEMVDRCMIIKPK